MYLYLPMFRGADYRVHICAYTYCHIISKLKDVINFMEIMSIYTDYINYYDIFWVCSVFLSDVMISKQQRVFSMFYGRLM